MARDLGWSQSYLSHRLNGRQPFSIEDLIAIAEKLGISPSVLTSESAEEVLA